MSASDAEVEDIVMVHGLHMGKVVDKFLSATGDAVYDIKLIYSPFRVFSFGGWFMIAETMRARIPTRPSQRFCSRS